MNKELWKTAGRRALIGAPVGLAYNTVMNIIISLNIGDGKYYPMVPELAADFGSEIAAVIVQALCAMLVGAAFAGASVVWNTDWSLAKSTLVHLLVCSVATFPTAWLIRWMDHTPGGVLKYFAIFFVIYAATWIIWYMRMKKSISAINKKVNDLT